ncbi:putative glycolipid-binding domain-containing protein, partial [Micromonospora zhanjiangensis]
AAAGAHGAGLPGTEEPDRLEAALDIDLYGAPLFNTLPVRRLGLLGAEPGQAHRLTMAFVRLPSLEVLPAEQVYTPLGGTSVRFASGRFTADLDLDPDGYVVRYPGLARRADHPPS